MEYPKTSVNKLGRLPNRGTYDYATIHNLVNTSPILHVSFVDPAHPFPVLLPMIGCTGNFTSPAADPSSTPQDIYLHGHISGRLFRHATSSSSSSSSPPGLPMTITTTHLSGLVLSLSPFHNSCNYQSATLHGYATPITHTDEKLFALSKLTNNLLPSRWENSRQPPTPAELASTSVLKVSVLSASAKSRSGPPADDRNDLKNSHLTTSVWTGVLPYWGTWGEPVPASENRCEDVEGYIEEWRVRENERARVGAFEAAGV